MTLRASSSFALACALALASPRAAAQVSTEGAPPPVAPTAPPPAAPPPATPPRMAEPDMEATPPPEAAPREPSARDYVVAYYTGFQLGIAPGIIFPSGGGSPGLMLSLYGGYGIEAGDTIVIPGVRLTGAWPAGEFIGSATPGAKWVIPLGPFAPYVEAGAGPGYVSQLEKTGVALRAGLGFTVHPSRRFAIGLGAAYETITGTGVSYLGPTITLSF